MRLAYFSPMPPAKTGIATYSRHLVEALARECAVTVFSPTREAEPLGDIRIVNFAAEPARLEELSRHDQVLYHIGNNPWFHLDIWKTLRRWPGPVCLHDTVIYYLAAGMGRGNLLRELFLEDPAHALANLDAIQAECVDGDLLRYPNPSRHPALLGLLEAAPQIVVHNRTSAESLVRMGFRGRVDVIPLLHYADRHPPLAAERAQEVRRHLGFGDDDFVLGAFGFIGPPKRLDQVLQALARLVRGGLPRTPRLLVVGEGDSLEGRIRELELEPYVKTLGFVGDEDFRHQLQAVDVLVNLRYPSHGESSASLVQAMSYGRVCMVTDHAWFAELPDATVVKVPHGEGEVEAIEARLRALILDPALHASFGTAARDHVTREHAPQAVATHLAAVLAATASPALPPADESFDPQRYLQRRAHQLADPLR